MAALALGALSCGCTTPQQIAAGVATVGALSPGQEIEQIYYLGVLDPQEQLPTSLYRVHVRGQASLISRMKFQSGWVPSSAVDSLTVTPAFGKDGGVVIDRTGEREAMEEAARKDADLETATSAVKQLQTEIESLEKAEADARKAADALEPKGASLDLLVAVTKRNVETETKKRIQAATSTKLHDEVKAAVVATLPTKDDFTVKPLPAALRDAFKKKGDAPASAAAKTDGPLSAYLRTVLQDLTADQNTEIGKAVGDAIDADPLLTGQARFVPRLADDTKTAAIAAIREEAAKQAGDAANAAFGAQIDDIATKYSDLDKAATEIAKAKEWLHDSVVTAVRAACDASLAGKVDAVAVAVKENLSARGGETKSWNRLVAQRADADAKKADAEAKRPDLAKKRLAQAEARALAVAAHAVAAATTDGVSESLVRAQIADADAATLGAEGAALEAAIAKLKGEEDRLRGEADKLEPKEERGVLVSQVTQALKGDLTTRVSTVSASFETDLQKTIADTLTKELQLPPKPTTGQIHAEVTKRSNEIRAAVTQAGGPLSAYLREVISTLEGAAESIARPIGDRVDADRLLDGKARYASKIDEELREVALDAVRDELRYRAEKASDAAFAERWPGSKESGGTPKPEFDPARTLRKTIGDALVAAHDELMSGKLEFVVTAVRTDLGARGGPSKSWNHVVELRAQADAKKKESDAKAAELKAKNASATESLAKAAAARAAADIAKNGAGFKIGRRLVLFGPEGFRESPANHRLVILMGSSPEEFFQAAGNAVSQADQTLSAAESAGVSLAMFQAMNGLSSASTRLSEAEKSAGTELGAK